MVRKIIVVAAVLCLLIQNAEAKKKASRGDRKPVSEAVTTRECEADATDAEARRIATFADKVSRQGDELLLQMKDGTVVSRKTTSRIVKEFYDCEGNVRLAYTFQDFIDPWYVIVVGGYSGGATQFINRGTGAVVEVDGYASFAPDKTRFHTRWSMVESGRSETEVWRISPETITKQGVRETAASAKNIVWPGSFGAARGRHDSKLLSAIEGREVHQVKALLKKGANINAQDDFGNTPLILAVKNGDAEAVELLLTRGAEVNVKDGQCLTALQHVKPGKHEIAKLLVAGGADVNVARYDGQTPLMRASMEGQKELVALCVEKGADVNAKDKSGETALMHAVRAGNLEVVKLLLDKGADANAADAYDWTALSWAANFGHSEIVTELKAKGAEPSLLSAAWLGDLEGLRRIIGEGASINAKGANGRTPLMLAVKAGHLEVVKALLVRGADVNEKDEYCYTALQIARNRGHKYIEELLRDHGAKE